MRFLVVAGLVLETLAGCVQAQELPWIEVDGKGTGFARQGKRFVPWGFNYDHDRDGRLLEDYWQEEWTTVEQDFREMKELGANVVRIHLQLGKFMDGPRKPNEQALQRLEKLVELSSRTGLYIDLTGLGCYHKKDVPKWYDALPKQDRWDVQARFWEAIAKRCADSPAIMCYDLMNEPVVAGGKREDWLGPGFGGKHFVQFITLAPDKERPRHVVAREWIAHLVKAIRKHDRRHLITVGLVDWSLDRKGLTSGFIPSEVSANLDFISVHLYPQKGKVEEAIQTLKGFDVGKPIVIEETFPLKCSFEEFERFLDDSQGIAQGWIGFYWGKTPAELQKSGTLPDAIMARYLEIFRKRSKANMK